MTFKNAEKDIKKIEFSVGLLIHNVEICIKEDYKEILTTPSQLFLAELF
jgi:hypothetical protein